MSLPIAGSNGSSPDLRPVRGDEVDADLVLEADVCVVGSGAGGAVLAAELAQAGRDVVLLEEGGWHTRHDFNMREGDMLPLLYQERATRTTSDQAIAVLQGRTVGGSTVVNYTTCYRTPDSTLAYWKDRFGVTGLDAPALNPSWDKVEARLGIAEIELEKTNKNNRVIWEGAGKLGWHRELLRRNVRDCFHSGYCGLGCPFDAKQAMHITYVKDALAAGARAWANARVERLEREGGRITAVHATVLDPKTDRPTGRRITVKPKVTAVCGGGVNSPLLLLKSGITEGPVGRYTWFHPLVISTGIMPYRVEPFYGAPQSISCREFVDRGDRMGYFMETAAAHPVMAGLVTPGFGKAHRASLEKLPFINSAYAHLVDGFSEEESGATVTLKASGAPKVDYAYTPRLWEGIKDALKNLARLQLAAGAVEVRTLHSEPVVVKSEADLAKIDAAPLGPNRIAIITAHLMGGCRLGNDPATSVVRPDLRHHTVENLYVVDGSIFPTSLGVNPSLSIYGFATWAAKAVAEAAA